MRGSKSIVTAPKPFGAGIVRRSERYNQLAFFARSDCFGAPVTLGELFHASGRIDEFLFAGEKRMTSGADTDSNVALCRTGLIDRSTRANHVGLVIFWVNACFHVRNERRM